MPDQVTEQIVLGTIEITMSSGPRWYFGQLTGVTVTNSEGLRVYYAPSSTGDKRKAFGALGLSGHPGSLTLRGVLASNLPGEQCYTYRLASLMGSMFNRRVYASVTVTFDFSFGASVEDRYVFTLYDVTIGQLDMNAGAAAMNGTLVLNFSRSS